MALLNRHDVMVGVPHLAFIGVAIHQCHAGAIAQVQALVQRMPMDVGFLAFLFLPFFLAGLGVVLVFRVSAEQQELHAYRRRPTFASRLTFSEPVVLVGDHYRVTFWFGLSTALIVALVLAFAPVTLKSALTLHVFWGGFLLLPRVAERLLRPNRL